MAAEKNVWTVAKNAVEKALVYAYRDRRNKKRTFRALWIVRINAGVRPYGLSYSKFMGALKANNIELNRKVLADLALNTQRYFQSNCRKSKINVSSKKISVCKKRLSHKGIAF